MLSIAQLCGFLSLLELASQVPRVAALSASFEKRYVRGKDGGGYRTNLYPRNDSAPTSTDPYEFTNIAFKGPNDAIYAATIKIDGKPFVVQLDTGSRDLWVDTTGLDPSTFANTGVNANLAYADNSTASGPVVIANVTFGNFTVNKQVLVSAPGSNATGDGFNGLLGLGPLGESALSRSLRSRKDINKLSLMENIFATYPNESSYMTFALSRAGLGKSSGGVFTIGEIDPKYGAIKDTPKLPVPQIYYEWTVLVDYITINGNKVSGGSTNTSIGQQTRAILDTGTETGIVSKAYGDAMYAHLPGVKFNESDGYYTVPCDSKVEISYFIGGREFPIDPLDAVVPKVNNKTNEITCVGGWSVLDFAGLGYTYFDQVLGDSFLTNVYSLYDFGRPSSPGGSDNNQFVQLLSTTDAKSASANYEQASKARLDAFHAAFGKKSSAEWTRPRSIISFILLVALVLFLSGI